MILFDETGNKYYHLLSKLLCNREVYMSSKFKEIVLSQISNDPDFEVTDSIFNLERGKELLFHNDGRIRPIISGEFPIRCSILEQQALCSIVSNGYVRHFLSTDTIKKIKKVTNRVVKEWDPNDITIVNMFKNGASQANRMYEKDIATISKAIRESKCIQYDNVRSGRVNIKSGKAFPIKIEYSLVNDQFRVSAYVPGEKRFIKMNLDSMQNIIIKNITSNINLHDEYEKFVIQNTRKILLDVEPKEHVIERCFRAFSYYERKARYDRDANKYQLEISYISSDENEVIKNILSMGSSVLVMEPKRIQKEIYRRIEAAERLYQ